MLVSKNVQIVVDRSDDELGNLHKLEAPVSSDSSSDSSGDSGESQMSKAAHNYQRVTKKYVQN